MTPQDLGASLLVALGVDPGREVHDAFGRMVPLSGGQVKPAMFGAWYAHGDRTAGAEV